MSRATVLAILVLGLGFADGLQRPFVQTLLGFRILDTMLHALRIGHSFGMFDTGLRGLAVAPTVSLRCGCV